VRAAVAEFGGDRDRAGGFHSVAWCETGEQAGVGGSGPRAGERRNSRGPRWRPIRRNNTCRLGPPAGITFLSKYFPHNNLRLARFLANYCSMPPGRRQPMLRRKRLLCSWCARWLDWATRWRVGRQRDHNARAGKFGRSGPEQEYTPASLATRPARPSRKDSHARASLSTYHNA